MPKTPKQPEYATTCGRYYSHDITPKAEDPEVPDGTGWKLVAVNAVDGILIWTWSR